MTRFRVQRVSHRKRREPGWPARLGVGLALVATLGLTLASGHGLHAEDRLDLRADVAQLATGDTGPPASTPEAHDGSQCVFCRARSDSKALALHATPATGNPIERPRQHMGWRLIVQGGHTRWITAPASPRAPPIA